MRRGGIAMLLAAAATAVPAGETLPHPLTLQIVFPDDVGRESVREEIQHLLWWDLEDHRCFPSVSLRPPDSPGDDDLLFRVAVVDFEETTNWDISLSQRDRPQGPVDEARRRVTVRLRVDLRYELVALADGTLVRTRNVSFRQSYRPRFHEDPNYEARNLLMDEVVRSARLWVCKGTARRLEREIERARKRAAG